MHALITHSLSQSPTLSSTSHRVSSTSSDRISASISSAIPSTSSRNTPLQGDTPMSRPMSPSTELTSSSTLGGSSHVCTDLHSPSSSFLSADALLGGAACHLLNTHSVVEPRAAPGSASFIRSKRRRWSTSWPSEVAAGGGDEEMTSSNARLGIGLICWQVSERWSPEFCRIVRPCARRRGGLPCRGSPPHRGGGRLRELLYAYSNSVVTRAAAGAAGATAERMKELMGNSAAFMSGLQAEDVLPGAAAKMVRWATGLEKRIDVQVEAWDKFLSEIMAEHHEKKRDYGAGEEDFLDVLLRLRKEGTTGLELTDNRIKSIIKDMIFAGTETSSITLEWVMAELVGNPRVMAKLQDEVTRATNGKPTIEEDDLRRMEYLKAVLKEVLRLHPPAPLLVPHESTTAAVVQGYEIPAKTALFINAWAIARDPAAWGDAAEEFRPERFLDGASATDVDVDVRGNDYQLLPFGAGRRICPAINFALPVLEVAVASLVRHFDWELPAGTRLDMAETPGLVTPPLVPLRLVPKCRTPA